jgi:hypothetical protein
MRQKLRAHFLVILVAVLSLQGQAVFAMACQGQFHAVEAAAQQRDVNHHSNGNHHGDVNHHSDLSHHSDVNHHSNVNHLDLSSEWVAEEAAAQTSSGPFHYCPHCTACCWGAFAALSGSPLSQAELRAPAPITTPFIKYTGVVLDGLHRPPR